MSNAMTSRHSDAEQLAAFVDGHLDHEELQTVTAHLADCEECRAMIGEAVAFGREVEARHTRRRTWWAVAAGVAVVVVGAFPFIHGALRQRDLRNDTHALFVAEGIAGRPIDGRFAGQTVYGAHRVMRGGDSEGTL